ncbi:M20 family peptidase [Pseudonocardiaceae bacterium YIM PH 21723]|nr:M20 family peptidase [Pseudonocardiaceae bacterium YIM PH 21723]
MPGQDTVQDTQDTVEQAKPKPEYDPLTAAKEDEESVVALLRALVQVPSRAGTDKYEPVLEVTRAWLLEHKLPSTVLRSPDGSPLGMFCEIKGGHGGKRWVLNACLDTAPFGNEQAWSYAPTSAAVDGGWLYGRGAADSKAAVAIFCHLAARLQEQADDLHGNLVLLFDLDEHSGRFSGAKRYFEGPGAPDDVAGVMIGYPGLDHLVTGGRGVFRATVTVHGIASHSGGSASTPNAVEKAAHLIRVLSTADLPDNAGEEFPLPGKLTVTSIRGGEGFSTTPDVCAMNVDIRTTPALTGQAAGWLLDRLVTQVDSLWPGTPASRVDVHTRWPAFHLEPGSTLRSAILATASTMGLDITPKIAGPSNIGNYLAGRGIPATAGFGVGYENVHGTDERVLLATIPMVQAVYDGAVRSLLSG